MGQNSNFITTTGSWLDSEGCKYDPLDFKTLLLPPQNMGIILHMSVECVSADTHARYGCTFFLVLDYQSNTTQFLTKIWYENKISPKALVQ